MRPLIHFVLMTRDNAQIWRLVKKILAKFEILLRANGNKLYPNIHLVLYANLG
jgi:hypothetical protein